MTSGSTLYFGRGSSNCVGVTLRPGDYAKVFIGNGKAGEIASAATFSRFELHALGEFFSAVWREHGQDMHVSKIVDDPHDPVPHHNLDMETWEAP